MNKVLVRRLVLILLIFSSGLSFAQFLPANKISAPPLTQEILSRWINTNNHIQEYQVLIDSLLPTDAEAKAFDQLTVIDQDRIVNNFLKKKNQFEPVNGAMQALGWTGVADYMRASSQIGNALAADILAEKMVGLSPEAKKAVWEKTDDSIQNVTAADLAFVRANMNRIRTHIQSYSKQH